MKKTTYIEGLKLVYSDRVIDRSGVDRANRQDRVEADAQANAQTNAQAGTGPAGEADCINAGLDERGLWHTPNPELICLDDHRSMSWIGLRNGCILGAAFWVGVVLVVWLATR